MLESHHFVDSSPLEHFTLPAHQLLCTRLLQSHDGAAFVDCTSMCGTRRRNHSTEVRRRQLLRGPLSRSRRRGTAQSIHQIKRLSTLKNLVDSKRARVSFGDPCNAGCRRSCRCAREPNVKSCIDVTSNNLALGIDRLIGRWTIGRVITSSVRRNLCHCSPSSPFPDRIHLSLVD